MNKTEVMDMLRAEFQQLDREKLVERLVWCGRRPYDWDEPDDLPPVDERGELIVEEESGNDE